MVVHCRVTPGIDDVSIVDRVEKVTSDDAIKYSRLLAKEEGIYAGISCGAAICAAIRLAQQDEFAGKTIVAILPDSGERYLSSALFQGMFTDDGMAT